MIKRFLRELYLLPRGEQRAVLLLSLLLILSLVIRVTVQGLPGREPPGTDAFVRQAREIMLAMNAEDTLGSTVTRHPETTVSVLSPGLSPSPSPPININTADSSLLLPLPGIGPVLAGRIIKYRNLLGGFIRIGQLHEVYGLKPETFKIISNRLIIDTTAISTMDLNTLKFGDILRHPYLELADVKKLVNFREFNGGIHSMDEIHEHGLLPDSTLDKISPYLDFGR